jgi:hypothetical protein
MIGANPETANRIASQLRARSKAFTFPSGTEALCNQLLETVDSTAFPGALVPEQTADGEFLVVAIALPSDWRRLCPILRAFAGPTLTSFDGLPSTDLVATDLLAAVAAAGQCVTAAIKVPTDPGGREMALRALVRARDTFARAPLLTRTAPEPTSWLLARFQDHLNVGRRDAAAAVLHRLRDELRLDALNLRSLEVQLLSTFNEWAGIVNLPGFANLTRARRTPATTALLLEALYQAHLALPFEAGDQSVVESIYAQQVRVLAAPMLKAPLPASLRAGGWRLASLEVLCSPAREDLRTGAVARSNALGWLAPRLAAVSSPETSPVHRLDSTDEARERLIAGEAEESVDVMSAALAALARLDDTQRAQLVRAEPFRSAFRALEQEAGSTSVPNSWPMWLERISDPTFTNALALARMGAEEWPIAGDATDPVGVASLLDALNKAQSDSLAAERTAQALPYIVAALRRDALFPNSSMVQIYSSLLTLLALGGGRGSLVYDSSLVLVEALLSIGTDATQYREIVADVDELAGEGFGVKMVYWTLELIEAFMRSPSPDIAARDKLVHSVLARLMPLRGRLSCLQQAAVHSLSTEFGWTYDIPLTQTDSNSDGLASCLRGKSIAIYSLVEGASRQAKVALQALHRDIDVQCSADQGGTSQLRALAINSDLFVVAWAAAKHAATDFIRAHRGDRPLVYAEGKGVSSLLRAVEDYFAVQTNSKSRPD